MWHVGYWIKYPEQRRDAEQFAQFAKDMDLEIFWPNKARSPWHVQAKIGIYGRYPQKINFWPHKLRGYWEGLGTRTGVPGLTELVNVAADTAYEGDFDLVEDDAQTLS